MGLTIHYEFFADVDAAGARRMVESLHEEALRLTFDGVGALEELGPPGRVAAGDPDESEHADWLRLRATHHVEHRDAQDKDLALPVPPIQVITFRVQPKGAWHASCETQYAALPANGGQENFLRVHKDIVRLLDHAASIGIDVAVRDEGCHWDSRDDAALLRKLDEWNVMVAGIVGTFKDAAADRVRGAGFLRVSTILAAV